MKYIIHENSIHCECLDEISNSWPNSAFYELLEDMNKNNIKLLNKDDVFIDTKPAESQMLKMKLNM